jgi:2,4-dienoyl-CoA reductase-like NADH-dependent reductase (Old Yellow Enzyme family)/thioredoxin reductase
VPTPTHASYPRVFGSIRLGPVEIPNRFYFSPNASALSVGTKPSRDLAYYLRARVQGSGCGLVIPSMTAHTRGRSLQSSPFPPENIPSFRAMADTVHQAGGKIFGQLLYWWGSYGQWQPMSPPAPSLAPSAVQYGIANKTVSTHAMDKAEIRSMIDAFRQSVENLRGAGWDGVMLHGSHGGLIEQFLSPYFNRRTDEYGGTLQNRMRFLRECLEACRDAAKGSLAVGMRLNCDELLPGGYDTKLAHEILHEISTAGLIDFVDLDIAIEPNQFYLGMPPVYLKPHVYRPYVEAVRGAAGAVPVLSVLGRLTSIADGEAAIAAGVCDMVGAARALIAEPELVKNAYEGREERSRICIACNWCVAAIADGAQGCTINPASYRERLWGVDTFGAARATRTVIVVGAGPAGLEAARVSALKGHDVTLFEARTRLGGALALWADLPGREDFRRAIEWWEREIERLGVKIRRGTEAAAETLLHAHPHAVIVATGARYSAGGRSHFVDADIPGYEQSFVHRPEDILLGNTLPTGKVVLLDAEGLNTSLGTAEVLANAGAVVQYLTPGFSPTSARLVDAHESRFIMKRLRAAGVTISTNTYIKRIGDHSVTAYDVISEEERTIEGIDAVVLSTARIPRNGLTQELTGKVAQLYTVGDALAARPWAAAAYEGQKFARYIGEPDAPTTVGEAYFMKDPPDVLPLPAEVLLAPSS